MSTCNGTKQCSCGCCATPAALEAVSNRPGLPALSYRVGTYGVFFEQLLQEISGAMVPEGVRPLASLTTQSADDPSIALLDAWANVADVLTFYQERIANEGFLRTATERFSILQLAREIGYELAPGVAATAWLAFTVEEIIGVAPAAGALSAPGPGNSPYNSGVVSIPKGSQVQSVPPPNGMPQTFETSTDFEGHVEWNNMQPRLTRPPDVALWKGALYLLGAGSRFPASYPGLAYIPPSELFLLNPLTKIDPSAKTVQAVPLHRLYLKGTSTNLKYGDRLLMLGAHQLAAVPLVQTIQAVETDFTLNQTSVTFIAGSASLPPFEPVYLPPDPLPSGKVAFTHANVAKYILENTVRESELQGFLKTSGWDAADLMAAVNTPLSATSLAQGAFAMRASAAFFGNNAPLWKSLTSPSSVLRADPYPLSWDAANQGQGRSIWSNSQGLPHANADVLLERSFPQVLDKSWAYFTSPQAEMVYRIANSADQSLSDYGTSGKVTGLTLELPAKDKPSGMGSPSAVTTGSKRIDVFAIGSDGNLYRRWWDGAWHGLDNLGGGNLINTPAAISWGSDRIDVFAIGSNGNMYHWSNNASGLQDLGGGYLVNSPAAVSWEPGRLDVFAVGLDGGLYHFWTPTLFDGQKWDGIENLGGSVLVNSPAAVSRGVHLLDVFINGSDGVMYVNTFDSQKWLGMAALPPIPGKAVQSPAAVRIEPAAVYVVSLNSNGDLLWTDYFGSVQIVGWLSRGGGNLASTPAAIRWPQQQNDTELLSITTVGTLKHSSTSVGLDWNDIGGGGNLVGIPSGVSRADSSLDIFVTDDRAHWLYFRYENNAWRVSDLGGPDLPDFLVRNTTAYVQSEQQPLDALPVRDNIPAGSGSLMLNNLTLGLSPGRRVALSGARADSPGVTATEMLILKDVVHTGGFTVLEFTRGLAHSYRRNTVSINANLVTATHGATVQEVLGGGDASQPNQSFALKRPPLTYVGAAVPGGARSTLEVQVNNLAWTETPTLYGLGPRSQKYTVRLADDGTPTLTFGDPAARLKSGQHNVRATYRTGIGLAGNVDAGSLTILMTRPPGARGVVNPLPASGGADPQDISGARSNAPLTVLTLDRIVSAADYENFCRAFAGVGKAQAVEIWSGQTRLVHITIATSDGQTVDPSLPLYTTLLESIVKAHDPVQRFSIAGYRALVFNLKASLVLSPRYQKSEILAQVTAALKADFSFANRSFAQAVTAAEIVRLIQSVPGVVATNLVQLYLTTNPKGPQQTAAPPFLASLTARWEFGKIQPAQLLLLNPLGVELSA